MARSKEVQDRIDEGNRFWEEWQHKKRQAEFVMPECCQQMIDTATIILLVSKNFCSGDIETLPTWGVRTGEPKHGCYGVFLFTKPKFCPFCAAPLPEIDKRVTDRKIMVVKDGGDYCNTCGERCNCCSCLPPAFHWQPKGSVRVIPELPKNDEE